MKLFSFLFITFLISSVAYTGQEGHGGASVVCRNKITGEIKSAKLLDIWEGQLAKPMGLGLTIVEDNRFVGDIVDEMIKKLSLNNPVLGNLVNIEYKKLFDKIFILPADIAIADPHDTQHQFLPEGCAVEYAANYQENVSGQDILFISKNIADKLGNRDYAALLLHEAVFKVFRTVEKNSLRARKLVAYLFSNVDFPKATVPTDILQTYSCHGWDASSFWTAKMYETRDSFVFDYEEMANFHISTQKIFTIKKSEFIPRNTNVPQGLLYCNPHASPDSCIVHPTESVMEGGEKLVVTWVREDDQVKNGYIFHISFADENNPYGAEPFTQEWGGQGTRCLPVNK
jgi:hypothetical protein